MRRSGAAIRAAISRAPSRAAIMPEDPGQQEGLRDGGLGPFERLDGFGDAEAHAVGRLGDQDSDRPDARQVPAAEAGRGAEHLMSVVRFLCALSGRVVGVFARGVEELRLVGHGGVAGRDGEHHVGGGAERLALDVGRGRPRVAGRGCRSPRRRAARSGPLVGRGRWSPAVVRRCRGRRRRSSRAGSTATTPTTSSVIRERSPAVRISARRAGSPTERTVSSGSGRSGRASLRRRYPT